MSTDPCTNAVAGNGDCNSWTSSSAAHNGTRANLQPQWATAWEVAAPWGSTMLAFDGNNLVCCVED
ncbi:MAG: hypothetical protein IPK27_06590 [Rhodanobacteraceae bacterium]|nr:hypothetical protein [Rhodanobacteraceae bacterium]